MEMIINVRDWPQANRYSEPLPVFSFSKVVSFQVIYLLSKGLQFGGRVLCVSPKKFCTAQICNFAQICIRTLLHAYLDMNSILWKKMFWIFLAWLLKYSRVWKIFCLFCITKTRSLDFLLFITVCTALWHNVPSMDVLGRRTCRVADLSCRAGPMGPTKGNYS